MRVRLVLAGVLVLILGAVAQDDRTTTSTTTAAPPTTTKTTPEPPETTTSTTMRTTTTIAPTPTTAKPTPVPKYPANKGKYVVTDSEKTACIMLEAAIEVAVQYTDANNKTQTGNVDVPANLTVDGDCKKGSMSLTWDTNKLVFDFEKNEMKNTTEGISEGKFALQNVTGVVSVMEGNDTKTLNITILKKAAFQTPLNRSYLCAAQETLKSDDGKITIKFNSLHLEAFMSHPSGHSEFSPYYECAADDASDVVPIIVGSVLAGLIVVVLVAYLIGRRRSRSRGYQSV